MTTLQQFIAKMEQCEIDSLRCLGSAHSRRFLMWRRFAADPQKLAGFVRDCTRRTSINGWSVYHKGGLSLEAVVIEIGEPLFTSRDIAHARETLRLVQTVNATR